MEYILHCIWCLTHLLEIPLVDSVALWILYKDSRKQAMLGMIRTKQTEDISSRRVLKRTHNETKPWAKDWIRAQRCYNLCAQCWQCIPVFGHHSSQNFHKFDEKDIRLQENTAGRKACFSLYRGYIGMQRVQHKHMSLKRQDLVLQLIWECRDLTTLTSINSSVQFTKAWHDLCIHLPLSCGLLGKRISVSTKCFANLQRQALNVLYLIDKNVEILQDSSLFPPALIHWQQISQRQVLCIFSHLMVVDSWSKTWLDSWVVSYLDDIECSRPQAIQLRVVSCLDDIECSSPQAVQSRGSKECCNIWHSSIQLGCKGLLAVCI